VCGGDYTGARSRHLPNVGDSRVSKTSRPLPLELGLAFGTMEKVRTIGAPAFPGSTGLVGF
jgi:hypothetical protein